MKRSRQLVIGIVSIAAILGWNCGSKSDRVPRLLLPQLEAALVNVDIPAAEFTTVEITEGSSVTDDYIKVVRASKQLPIEKVDSYRGGPIGLLFSIAETQRNNLTKLNQFLVNSQTGGAVANPYESRDNSSLVAVWKRVGVVTGTSRIESEQQSPVDTRCELCFIERTYLNPETGESIFVQSQWTKSLRLYTMSARTSLLAGQAPGKFDQYLYEESLVFPTTP